MLRTIQLYEQLSYFESSSDFAQELVQLRNMLVQTKDNLNQQVSSLLTSLRSQILNDKLPSKQGFFTGIHKWWKNLWGGDKNKNNPYYWQNKIGALGRTDIDPPTVKEYRMLQNLAKSLAEATEASKPLLLDKILAQWQQRLKHTIGTYLDAMISRVDGMTGRTTSRVEPTQSAQDHAQVEPEENPSKTSRPTAKMPLNPVAPASVAPAPTDLSDDGDLDAKAAAMGIEKDTKLLGTTWKALHPREKLSILNQCSTNPQGPNCPAHKKTEDEILEVLKKHQSTALKKIVDDKNIDPEEKKIILAVHEPWLSLSYNRRNEFNREGNNGRNRKSNNRFILGHHSPYALPPVLRKEDPRYGILQKYYHDLFRDLYKDGRVERDEDTPESIKKRIERKIPQINKEAKISKDSGHPTETESDTDDKPVATVGRRTTAAMKGTEEEQHEKPKMATHKMGAIQKDLFSDEDDVRPEDNPDDVKHVHVKKIVDKIAKTNEELANKISIAWSKLKDPKTRNKFSRMLKAGKYDAAIALAKDDEVVEWINSPNLVETLKRKLRFQSEGKVAPARPKLDPKSMLQQMREQSQKIYELS